MDKKETVISEEQKIRTQIKELGARLKSIREAQELSISDISNTTKIQKHYLAAIEEGATIIRVGTAIFGERIYPDSYYWNEQN